MYCRSCGVQNPDGAATCTSCGAALDQPGGAAAAVNPYSAGAAAGPVGQKPPNYLVQSILVTFCCCLVLGIPAIVYAAQVDSKWNAGDLQGAAESSGHAKKWCWIAFGVGLVVQGLYLAINIVAVAGAAANANNGGGF